MVGGCLRCRGCKVLMGILTGLIIGFLFVTEFSKNGTTQPTVRQINAEPVANIRESKDIPNTSLLIAKGSVANERNDDDDDDNNDDTNNNNKNNSSDTNNNNNNNNGKCPEDGTVKVTVTFPGRLGNNMFQYAALLGIAKMNSMVPVLPASAVLFPIFPNMNITTCDVPPPPSWLAGRLGRHDDVPPPLTWPVVTFKESAKYEDKAQNLTLSAENVGLYVWGYFNSWKYFANVEELIRQQFVFASHYRLQVGKFLETAVSGFSLDVPLTFIGVHIRRGDLSWSKAVRDIGFVMSNVSYIERAMDYYERKFNHVVFVVCSDDKKWAINNVKSKRSRVVFSNFADAAPDLCLLASCNHTVITTGTFGWWGGWLAGGEVVYDSILPTEGSSLRSRFNPAEYYPPNWTSL